LQGLLAIKHPNLPVKKQKTNREDGTVTTNQNITLCTQDNLKYIWKRKLLCDKYRSEIYGKL